MILYLTLSRGFQEKKWDNLFILMYFIYSYRLLPKHIISLTGFPPFFMSPLLLNIFENTTINLYIELIYIFT